MNELQVQLTWWSLTKQRHILPSRELSCFPALTSCLAWLSATLAQPAFAYFDHE